MQENKKVLLINPPPSLGWNYRYKYSYSPPLGLLSLGTVLRQKGYRVRIIDGAQDENYLINAKKEITHGKFNFIGISVMTAQVPGALELSRSIKKMGPDNLVVWGGVHPTLFPGQVCADGAIDVAVIGEGEFTAIELAEAFVLEAPLDKVPGIAYKKDGKVIVTTARPQADINSIPFFDYDLLDVEYYIVKDRTDVGGKFIRGGPLRRSLPVLSGLGCPYNCKFCIASVLKNKYRRRNAVKLVEEIKRLIERYRINDVSFIDDLFFADKKWFMEFLDLIESQKLRFSWSTNVRANYFKEDYLNIPLLKRMRGLGCYHLGLGAESGSQRILDKVDKGITRQQVLNAARLCKESRINLVMSFMIGFPGETPEEMRETIKFAFQAVGVNPENSYINGPNVYRPYPGSALFEEAVRDYAFGLPGSLEEWSSVYSHNEGYFKLEDLPWIKEPELIRIYCFYLFRATTNFVYPNSLVNYFAKLLKLVSRLRVKASFYNFPLEYMFVENARAIAAKVKL
jgi:radical SAM superfamily enzyme YgiQ (UPF0313 family)